MRMFEGRPQGRRRQLRALAWPFLAAATIASADALADPRIIGDPSRIECKDALALAQAAFAGPSFTLDVSISKLPAGLRSRFAIAADDDGDEALPQPPVVDEDSLERIALDDSASTVVIWQRRAPGSMRWVETHHEWGWRGTYFGLYDVPATLGRDDFGKRVERGGPDDDAGVTSVIDGMQEPLFLHAPGADGLWVIDTGEPWRALGGWKVLVQGDNGPESPCAIGFGLPADQPSSHLLPPELARLDALLLDALGPGTGEGSLHPTNRINTDVQRTWANIALRPWSLPQPYNTREEVDAGLEDWATQDASQQIELARIHALYPRAQRALAAYYRQRFHLSGEQARHCAAHALDVALRMHFVFHSDRAKEALTDPPEPNPWPDRSPPAPRASAPDT